MLPFGVHVRRCWERLQDRSVCRVEQGTPARAQVPRHAVVECNEALPERRVRLRLREELAVPELGDDPARRDLHGDFDLGFVARLPGPRRHDRRAVVRRHLSIGSIDGGLVEAGFGDAGLQIVGNHHRRNAAGKSESPCVRAYPARQRLRALVAINRNRRSSSTGNAGRHQPETTVAMPRSAQPGRQALHMKDGRTLAQHAQSDPSLLLGEGLS